MALSLLVADAVVDEINSQLWSYGISSATRDFRPVSGLKDLEDQKITVIPTGVKSEKMTRGVIDNEVEVQIGIQKKFDEEDECDDLTELLEEIAGYFLGKTLTTYSSAICLKSQIDPLFSPEHVDALRTFTGVITLTFKVPQNG
jgi:hypothetical protein